MWTTIKINPQISMAEHIKNIFLTHGNPRWLVKFLPYLVT